MSTIVSTTALLTGPRFPALGLDSSKLIRVIHPKAISGKLL